MNRVNLISQSRRQDRAHRVRCRLWGTGIAGYAAVITAACVVYFGMDTFAGTGPLHDKLAELDAELQSIESEQAQISPVLLEQRLVLNAGRSITDQPDWSMLLIYLAEELLGDDVVLAGCMLEPLTEEGQNHNQNTSMLVRLAGYGKSAPAVSQFVLRLEESSLFNKVTLEKTNREPFLNGQAIVFEVHCLMSGSEGGHHE